MIDIRINTHNHFSIELKISFIASNEIDKNDTNEFSINTWLFVPNGLDINRTTYPKEQFYKDIKSNIRLITPVYTLNDIYSNKENPVEKLQNAFIDITKNPSSESKTANYTFHVKMFASIFKSAMRDRTFCILRENDQNVIAAHVKDLIDHCTVIKNKYRETWEIISNDEIPLDIKENFIFGDNFIGDFTDQYAYTLMQGLENRTFYNEIKSDLYHFVKTEFEYKKEKGYSILNVQDPSNNNLVVMRRSILKKFIESDLYLYTKKTQDGAWAKQVFYGIAAAISMIFATIIAFTAQLRYGNFTTPLFVALVIGYAFKDRIKEIMRHYFSTQLDKKYFDSKRELEIQNIKIGMSKESFDFVSEAKIPEQVLALRKRTPLVEAENKIYNEKIILYRKLVNLSDLSFSEYKGYSFNGINDITRFNLVHFTRKMDNPIVPLFVPDEQSGYSRFKGERVYALHMIIRCEGVDGLYYKKFRILLNREGIKNIEEIKMNE